VPSLLVTGTKLRELRDIRIAVEGLAAARAAERIAPEAIAKLRAISTELYAARERGDVATDIARQSEFQFGIYNASEMPSLVRIIESLWLRTGPYLKLLFPAYIQSLKTRRGDWRSRLCAALKAHDAVAARREIEADVGEALEYLATLADAAGPIRPESSGVNVAPIKRPIGPPAPRTGTGVRARSPVISRGRIDHS